MDWNSDGNDDLIVGDGLSNVYLFLNTSASDLPLFNNRTLLITNNNVAGAARVTPISYDWNNDGNKDIIAGGMDGQIKIYINKGNDSAPLFDDYSLLHINQNTFDVGSRSAPRIYDYDKDGLQGILVGELYGHVYLLKNVGTLSIPLFKRAEKLYLRNGHAMKYPGEGPRSRLDITDWNNDGLDDIIVGGATGQAMLFMASQDSSVPLSSILNRAMFRSIESLIKVKHWSKLFLKSMRDRVQNKD